MIFKSFQLTLSFCHSVDCRVTFLCIVADYLNFISAQFDQLPVTFQANITVEQQIPACVSHHAEPTHSVCDMNSPVSINGSVFLLCVVSNGFCLDTAVGGC